LSTVREDSGRINGMFACQTPTKDSYSKKLM